MLDVWRLGQEIGALLLEGGGDTTRQMRLAAGFVREGVEDGVSR